MLVPARITRQNQHGARKRPNVNLA